MPAFDGLRGVTVVIIMIGHMAVLWNVGRLLVIPGAYISLDSFFVLSGFLITALLLKEEGLKGGISFGRFYARRALRLFPALAVLLIAYVIYVALAGYPVATPPGFELKMLASIVFYFWNWRIAFNAPESFFWPPGLKHLWSLSVEEQFYLVWPVVVGVVLTARRRLWINVAAIGTAIVAIGIHRHLLYDAGRSTYSLYHRTDTRADSLLIGALLAHLWVKGMVPRRFVAAMAWVATAFLIWCLIFTEPYDPVLYQWSLFTVIGVAWAIVVLAILEHVWVGSRLFEVGIFCTLGEVSYGLYLWHLPIYVAVAQANTGWPVIVEIGVALALTAAATCASWFFIEQPFLRLKDRLTPSVSRAAPDPAPTTGT